MKAFETNTERTAHGSEPRCAGTSIDEGGSEAARPTPPRPRRRGVALGLLAGALVLLGAGGAVLGATQHGSGHADPLWLPESIDGLAKQPNSPDLSQGVDMSGLPKGTRMVVGLYGSENSGVLVRLADQQPLNPPSDIPSDARHFGQDTCWAGADGGVYVVCYRAGDHRTALVVSASTTSPAPISSTRALASELDKIWDNRS
jgi:hypothetical protein